MKDKKSNENKREINTNFEERKESDNPRGKVNIRKK
jgi:hypothetical protein